jgi:hypothetical protein
MRRLVQDDRSHPHLGTCWRCAHDQLSQGRPRPDPGARFPPWRRAAPHRPSPCRCAVARPPPRMTLLFVFLRRFRRAVLMQCAHSRMTAAAPSSARTAAAAATFHQSLDLDVCAVRCAREWRACLLVRDQGKPPGHLPGRRRALGDILGQTRSMIVSSQALGTGGSSIPNSRRRALSAVAGTSLICATTLPVVERRFPGEQFVERGAERIDVVGRPGKLPEQLLRTHVGERAARRLVPAVEARLRVARGCGRCRSR